MIAYESLYLDMLSCLYHMQTLRNGSKSSMDVDLENMKHPFAQPSIFIGFVHYFFRK